jgi:hypothetical protein
MNSPRTRRAVFSGEKMREPSSWRRSAGMQSGTFRLPVPKVTRVQRYPVVRGVMVATIVVWTVMVYGIVSCTAWGVTEKWRPSLQIQRRSEYCSRHKQQKRIPAHHRMCFLSVWTAETLPLFGASLEITRNNAQKRSGPGVPARAKTIFPVIDRSRDSSCETIKSL